MSTQKLIKADAMTNGIYVLYHCHIACFELSNIQLATKLTISIVEFFEFIVLVVTVWFEFDQRR